MDEQDAPVNEGEIFTEQNYNDVKERKEEEIQKQVENDKKI